MLKPTQLHPGDKVATVSLSWGGPGKYPERYRQGKQQLVQQFGLEVVEMPHTLRTPEWLAEHPEARAADLMTAFADSSIKGIFSTIGGDDSIRLLPYIDLDVIRANPKVFIGFSDTTVTHLACLKAGLVSFYGPSIMAGFDENGGLLPYSEASVRKTLFEAEPVGPIAPNQDGWTVERLDWGDPATFQQWRAMQPTDGWRFLQGAGTARGPLIGGCLEVLEWLRGTKVWPDREVWEGAILFLETSEEGPPPEIVTRTLRTYAATGVLERLSGLLFGRPGGTGPQSDWERYDEAILQVVAHEQGLTQLPIITRMDFGHTTPVFVLPYGVTAEIDSARQQFAIVESAVGASHVPT